MRETTECPKTIIVSVHNTQIIIFAENSVENSRCKAEYKSVGPKSVFSKCRKRQRFRIMSRTNGRWLSALKWFSFSFHSVVFTDVFNGLAMKFQSFNVLTFDFCVIIAIVLGQHSRNRYCEEENAGSVDGKLECRVSKQTVAANGNW